MGPIFNDKMFVHLAYTNVCSFNVDYLTCLQAPKENLFQFKRTNIFLKYNKTLKIFNKYFHIALNSVTLNKSSAFTVNISLRDFWVYL